MDERKILDLVKPLLRTWSSESHLMSMILLQENAKEWIYNNYINICGREFIKTQEYSMIFFPDPNPEEKNSTVNGWVACPFLDVSYVSHDYVKNNFMNILEYIMYAIESGYYIFFRINQEKLSTRIHLEYHKIFIYGYDKHRKKLYVADHYNNGKYATAEIGFEEFLEAYNLTYQRLFEQKGVCEEHQIIIASPKAHNYVFNLDWLRIQLDDYLKSTYTLDCISTIAERDNERKFFGISCYNVVLQYLDKLLIEGNSVHKDLRIFTFICDHKKLLKMRCEFLKSERLCDLSNEDMECFDELCKWAEMLLNLFMKYMVSKKRDLLVKMKMILMQMKRKEKHALEKLTKMLDQERTEEQNEM